MDFKSLPSQYDHAAAQQKWYSCWEERGYFHASADPDDKRPPYTIVIPPPNVTGALHLGHALNNTLQDILIRMKRMQGYNTLWMPGTDHAGIATQAVVERRLFEEEKKTRHELGREGLVKRIWDWKDRYEARILGQLRQLGCSCDWQRTRFTLDDQCARAVREWFFRLFKDGKIYRGKRLVNWDTFLQTAVSDDEVFHEPVKGHFWHFKYPVIDPKSGEPTHVTIATTRPETMLGDTAVAVHPDPGGAFDKLSTELREKLLVASAKDKGELEEQMRLLLDRRAAMEAHLNTLRDMAKRSVMLELPLTGRRIPLILDEWAKPELGSGAVKITPAHDANDYDVWQRHPEIGAINILNPDGTLNENVPEKYRGLTVKKARDAVVADMETANLVVQVEDREIDLAHSDRSKTPIEPYMADQWFVKMDDDLPSREGPHDLPLPPGEGRGEGESANGKTPSPCHLPGGEGSRGLAQTAMDAVTSGRVKITPDRYAKGYLDWLSEKRDWPIGRQLWWGHQIPVWCVTLNANVYLQETKSRKASLERVVSEFRLVLDDYAFSSSVANDLFTQPSENSESTYYICARSDRAVDEVRRFYHRNYHQAHVAWTGDDRPKELPLNQNDRRVVPEQRLLKLIAVMKEQVPDVLDTWFSSALWPISTLGWPVETPELAKFYPTSTLVTSRDIITLWVARMVIAGLYNVGEVPFREVYITPKILDGYGETMSKSKGNGVDPLDVIEKFGADALRFGLAYLTTDTQDVKLPVEFECPHCDATFAQTKKNRVLPRVECEKCGKPFGTQWAEKPEEKALPRGAVVSERFELGRNFANKLWNAARFSLINLEGNSPAATSRGYIAPASGRGEPRDGNLLLEDRWLLSRLSTVTQQVTDALEHYRYADAARTLYDFAWNEFCSFYVEMTKARFLESPVGGDSVADGSLTLNDRAIGVGDASHSKQVAQRVLAHALDVLMRLLHPMMPFLTEEVWQLLAQVAPERGLPAASKAKASVCIATWPSATASYVDATIEKQFADFQAVLGAVREARQRQNIPFKEELNFTVRCDEATAKLLTPMQPYFGQMARAMAAQIGPKAEPTGVPISFTLAGQSGPIEVHVDVSRFIDVAAERKRLEKERDNLAKQISGIDAKLANKAFVERAPAEVVLQQRDKLAELRGQLMSVEDAFAKLPG
jgi:valyl-tRNA synthetase